jgi:hypothetical protein
LVNKIVLENSILSNSESCDGYPFNLQQFRDLITPLHMHDAPDLPVFFVLLQVVA